MIDCVTNLKSSITDLTTQSRDFSNPEWVLTTISRISDSLLKPISNKYKIKVKSAPTDFYTVEWFSLTVNNGVLSQKYLKRQRPSKI
jgi:hypothetical protein